ncbi:MAG TPA: hypothetical protein VFB15_07925 [Candidatus Binataceae bacterium]|nr:hypothetical protein [Candidatus Binataceae bacterium]
MALAASFLAATSLMGATDSNPDINMLLNLDLFSSSASAAPDATPDTGNAAPESMLDQIRTLNAMGYLGDPNDGADASTPSMPSDDAPGSAAEDLAPQP